MNRSDIYFIFIDEQDDEQQKYSAVVACAFPSGAMHDYRKFIISGLRRVFGRASNEALPFPVLHASALPASLSEDKKIELFNLFSEAIALFASGVYRIGYGWDHAVSVGFGMMGQQASSNKISGARYASVSTLRHSLAMDSLKPQVFIYELDKRGFERMEPYYSDTKIHQQILQMSEIYGEAVISEYDGVLGAFYTPKENLFMYSVDFVSYQLKINSKAQRTPFQSECAASSHRYTSKIWRNDVVMIDHHQVR